MIDKKDIVRKVSKKDSRRVWEIRNHPLCRQNFSNQEKIDFNHHNNWFQNQYFKNKENLCFVLQKDGLVVGYCRFDSDDDSFIVSTALDPDYHGKGLGYLLLSESLKKLVTDKKILATVKKGNGASIKLFQKNNFKLKKEDEINYYFIFKKMEKSLNKLALGTVQFGLDYGINNPNGKPSRKKSLEMLKFAHDNGIRIFDTAYAYGDAEEILGDFSKRWDLNKKIKIISKLKPNTLEEFSGRKAQEIIESNLSESLARLNREYLDGYLLHTPGYIRNKEVVKSLANLKKRGLVKNIGVSIYEERDAIYAAGLKEVDYIQIPYSIFDQRLDRTNFFQLAKKNHITIFARSAFLQGLFFVPDEKIPASLKKVKIYFRKLDKIISKYNLSRKEAAFLFSYKNKNIDHVVFGVDNTGQLAEDIAMAEKNIDCEKCIKELKENFNKIEKYIIFPSLWKK